jgi:hypothetical protein
MDRILRILQRAALTDPDAKDRYIHALELSIGIPSIQPFELIDLVGLVKDVRDLGVSVGGYILENGEEDPNNPHVIIWSDPVSEDNHIQGLALGTSTRSIVMGFTAIFGARINDLKTWSAGPVLPYDEVHDNYDVLNRYIYNWELNF